MDLKTAAPTLEKHITSATLTADLTNVEKAAPAQPKLLKAKVEAAYALLKQEGIGDVDIAQEVDLTTKQVVELRKELEAAKAEINSEEE